MNLSLIGQAQEGVPSLPDNVEEGLGVEVDRISAFSGIEEDNNDGGMTPPQGAMSIDLAVQQALAQHQRLLSSEDTNVEDMDSLSSDKKRAPDQDMLGSKKKRRKPRLKLSDMYPTIPPGTEGIDKVRDEDVLSGRGGGTNLHPGNRHFRELINLHRRAYLQARKTDKPAISRAIVDAIRENNGRFLKKEEQTGLWYEIGDEQAREKAGQALRQRAPQLKKMMKQSEQEEQQNEAQALQQHQMALSVATVPPVAPLSLTTLFTPNVAPNSMFNPLFMNKTLFSPGMPVAPDKTLFSPGMPAAPVLNNTNTALAQMHQNFLAAASMLGQGANNPQNSPGNGT